MFRTACGGADVLSHPVARGGLDARLGASLDLTHRGDLRIVVLPQDGPSPRCTWAISAKARPGWDRGQAQSVSG